MKEQKIIEMATVAADWWGDDLACSDILESYPEEAIKAFINIPNEEQISVFKKSLFDSIVSKLKDNKIGMLFVNEENLCDEISKALKDAGIENRNALSIGASMYINRHEINAIKSTGQEWVVIFSDEQDEIKR